jgi:hypothetical protein
MSDRGQAIQSLLDCIDVIQTEELASEYAPTIRRARYAIGLLQTAQAQAVNQQLLEALKHIMKMQTFGYIVLGEEATTKARAAIAAAQEQGK